jgi:hypothetical protein
MPTTPIDAADAFLFQDQSSGVNKPEPKYGPWLGANRCAFLVWQFERRAPSSSAMITAPLFAMPPVGSLAVRISWTAAYPPLPPPVGRRVRSQSGPGWLLDRVQRERNSEACAQCLLTKKHGRGGVRSVTCKCDPLSRLARASGFPWAAFLVVPTRSAITLSQTTKGYPSVHV